MAAQDEWKTKRGRVVFRVVEETLDTMCSPPVRCMYCEDNGAYQVEHFRPKSLYPRLVFAWANFLYACGQCNGPKLNRFAIFSKTGALLEQSTSDTEPDDGPSVLLDPRHEDPMEYLRLDLQEPFYFRKMHPERSTGYERARVTLDWLGLNRRDELLAAREAAYEAYVSHLCNYAEQKRAGASRERLARIERAIRRTPHATVFREMQRQRLDIDELRELFDRVPEAIDW